MARECAKCYRPVNSPVICDVCDMAYHLGCAREKKTLNAGELICCKSGIGSIQSKGDKSGSLLNKGNRKEEESKQDKYNRGYNKEDRSRKENNDINQKLDGIVRMLVQINENHITEERIKGWIREDIRDELNELIRENAKLSCEIKMLRQERVSTEKHKLDYVSYAEKIRKVCSDEVIIVKPLVDQQCEETKKDIKKHVDVAKLGISVNKVKKGNNGSIIIGCEKSKDKDCLKQNIEKVVGKKYKIEVPSLKKPKLKIIGIDKDDCKKDDESLISTIVKQNEDKLGMQGKEAELRILRRINNVKYGDMSIIVEISTSWYETIMKTERLNINWNKCRVTDFVGVLRCYKCWRHMAKECRKEETCLYCAGNHESEICVKKDKMNEIKCVNCITRNKFIKEGKLDISHRATDKCCPCYILSKRRGRKRNTKASIDNSGMEWITQIKIKIKI